VLVEGADDFFEFGEIGAVDGDDVTVKAAGFADVEDGVERGGVGVGQSGGAGDDVVWSRGSVFTEGNDGVAEERENAGKRFAQDGSEFLGVAGSAEIVLTKFEDDGAEFALDLQAMKIHGDVDGGYGVFAVEDLATFLHIENFDGEDVGRMFEFFAGEEERGGFVLFDGPPMDDGSGAGEFFNGEGIENAEKVQVGVCFVEITARGRAVEDYGFEIRGGDIFEPVHELG